MNIHQLVERNAATAGERVAVVDGERELSYRQLNARANQLARRLRQLGAGRDCLVGLLLPRSAEFVVAVVAVLKSGAAYLPMERQHPTARLAQVIDSARPRVVLTTSELAPHLPTGVAAHRLDQLTGETDAENLDLPVHPDNLAYAMFTSGSTGAPKGVLIPHRGVLRLIDSTDPVQYTRFGPAEAFLLHSPLSFDGSTFELWAALGHGGRVVIAPDPPLTPAELADLTIRYGVTQLNPSTGLFHVLTDENLADLQGLRCLITAGDVLSADHAARAVAALPDTPLVNIYGPTECTTYATFYPVPGDFQPGGTVPIGRPIAGTTVRVLDDRLRPVPAGVTGEIYLGGDGLARGYLNDPRLTAERFIPDPYATSPGARLYATGDLGRCLPDGNLGFVGRVDRQVKVRGVRVELAEVEAALRGHPVVKDAAVVASGGAPEQRWLSAYLVAAPDPAGGGSPPPTAAVRGWLAERLPEQLVPDRWSWLPELPLHPSGKVDRGALPRLAPQQPINGQAGSRAPVTQEEQVVIAVFEEVLQAEGIGVDDDFFDLGGHSLLAIKAATRIDRRLGSRVTVSAIFDYPTAAGLATHLRTRRQP